MFILLITVVIPELGLDAKFHIPALQAIQYVKHNIAQEARAMP